MEDQPDRKVRNKRALLKKELESMITLGRTGDRLPTYLELIRRFGVGQATIDYVIQELAVEGKVERRASRGLYITSLAKRRSIGILFDWDLSHTGEVVFERLLIEKCRQRIVAHGQHCAFYMHIPDEDRNRAPDALMFAQDAKLGRLEGVVLLGVEHDAIERLLEEAHIPRVLYSPVSTRTERVGIDYRNLIDQGVSALAYSGCKRIGLLTVFGPTRVQDPAFREDIEAFEAALAKHGLEVIPGAVAERRVEASDPALKQETSVETGYLLAQELFGGDMRNRLALDGLVVLNDLYTQGALVALEKHELRVPGDVRIATYSPSECSPLNCQAEKLIRLEAATDSVVAALFLMLEKWMLQDIRPTKPHLVPVTLRLPVAS